MNKVVFKNKLFRAQTMGYSIGVSVRLNYKDTFLLLKRSPDDFGPGVYEMPGGSIEPNESLEKAAGRELFEETGISISDKDLAPLGIFEFHNAETGKHKVKFAFSVTLQEKPVIRLSKEHSEYIFLSSQELRDFAGEDATKKYPVWSDHLEILFK